MGAQRHVWVGLVVLWGVEQEDGVGRFENLESEMQLPPNKDFPPGELLGWAVFVEKGMLLSCVMVMSVMLMWVFHANWFRGPLL